MHTRSQAVVRGIDWREGKHIAIPIVEESKMSSTQPMHSRSSVFITTESCAMPRHTLRSPVSFQYLLRPAILSLSIYSTAERERERERERSVHVGKAAFGSGAVRVHTSAPVWISCDVWHHLTEGVWKQSLVYLCDGGVHVLLRCGDTTRHVALAARAGAVLSADRDKVRVRKIDSVIARRETARLRNRGGPCLAVILCAC